MSYKHNHFDEIIFCKLAFTTSDIKKADIRQIAVEIHKNMPSVTTESYLEYLNSLETIIAKGESGKLRPYDPESGCLVTNLSKLPNNKLDFGTGNPDFIFPLTVGKNSAAILADKDNFILRLVY